MASLSQWEKELKLGWWLKWPPITLAGWRAFPLRQTVDVCALEIRRPDERGSRHSAPTLAIIANIRTSLSFGGFSIVSFVIRSERFN